MHGAKLSVLKSYSIKYTSFYNAEFVNKFILNFLMNYLVRDNLKSRGKTWVLVACIYLSVLKLYVKSSQYKNYSQGIPKIRLTLQ